MKSVLPGQPAPRLQALATGLWGSLRITTYITGSAIAILSEPQVLVQTIYDDDDDQALEAIALDEASGKIAVCTNRSVRIYKPFGKEQDALQWALQSSFSVERGEHDLAEGSPISLSWGSSEELLVGHAALELFDITEQPVCSWRKHLANPVTMASISYDSAYIASVSRYEGLVKVWRRLSYGANEVRFDMSYLRHPEPVTGLQWRRPRHVEQTVENVLYTFCADRQLRIWTASNSHGHQLLQLWGKLDLPVSLHDGAGAKDSPPCLPWVCVMHGRDFATATEMAVQRRSSQQGRQKAALKHLISVANQNPEICLLFDGHGRFSVFALENVGTSGTKNKKTCISKVLHAESHGLDFSGHVPGGSHGQATACAYSQPDGRINLLLHRLDGQVLVLGGDVVDVFDLDAGATTRLALECVWTGQSGPIRKMVRNFSGSAMVSRTEQGESVVWQHVLGSGRTTLDRRASIRHEKAVLRMCVLRKGRFVVFLLHDTLSIWDCQHATPQLLGEHAYDVPGKPLCLIALPRPSTQDYTMAHLVTITSEKQGMVWEVTLPPQQTSGAEPLTNGHGNGHVRAHVTDLARFQLHDAGDLANVLPVDPAGGSPVVSGFLDVFSKDVAISYTYSGRVEFWTARVHEGRFDWLSTSAMETGLEKAALVSGSTMKKAALANASRTTLTIWDVRGARLEYTREIENQHTIQDMDWTSTPDSQSVLAVGFAHAVILIAEMRFDYLNKGPAWAAVREINIRDMTPHPIGDSTWLSDGHLVIGAGNQLFVHDRQFDASGALVTSLQLPKKKEGMWDLFEVVQRLNGPLPVFHPQFLSQCLVAGRLTLVHGILLSLHKTLKFCIDGDEMDDYLGMPVSTFYMAPEDCVVEKGHGALLSRRASMHDGDEGFTEDVAAAIKEKLTQVAIPKLSGHEQMQLADMVECVGVLEKQRRSVDENGARFMLFFRQHALRKGRTNEITMSWREINWAYHSTSQDVLVDLVSRQGRFLWEHARESGMFMWLTDATAVRAQFEAMARNEYARSEPKSPVDCSLFYLALRKKTVLQGLWRMAGWNREQTATQRLLANNFEEPKWKTAALKNAYALMSKRRFQYAAAFFLLADHVQDAVNVCLNQLKDVQLGIAVARVYEGDQGPVLRKLLEGDVLRIAAQEGNRWLASWAFWKLNRRDMAVRALITPVYDFLEGGSADAASKLFLTDDPALVVLYAQLRSKTLQTGASKISPKAEWDFVLHNARLYDRMGCDLLALHLVRNWEFLKSVPVGGDVDSVKMLRRRSSLDAAESAPAAVSAPKTPRKEVTPAVFEEPDADSLLDNFGF